MSVISECNSVWCVWLGVAVCKKVSECGIRSWGGVSNGLWQFWVPNTVFSLSKSDFLGCEISMAVQTFTVMEWFWLRIRLSTVEVSSLTYQALSLSIRLIEADFQRRWTELSFEFLTVCTINCIFALALFSLDGWVENLPMETLQSAAVEVENFVLSAKLVSPPPPLFRSENNF